MTKDDLFELIAAERLRLAELAAGWTPEEWDTPSLAAGWRVREVIAHLTMGASVSVPSLLVGLVRHRGNFDRYADRWARDTAAARSTDDLVARLRAAAGSRFTPPGMGPEAPLTDVLVHGLDVRIPLGLPVSDLDPAALLVVLEFLTSKVSRNFGVAPGAFDGRCLEATDIDWSHGVGPTTRAPAAGLLVHLCRAQPLPSG